MNYQVDTQFVIRTNNLVREILSDESRFVTRNDQNFQTLHNKIFSKVDQTAFNELQPAEKLTFNKYFYIGAAVGSPRLDVPFANSREDQAFFFDQFRNQVKNLTCNYDRMDFLRPRFADDKSPNPTFDNNQILLLTRGIVYPCLSALEQRQIAKIEKKKASPGSDETVESPANPFANLGNKILVKGLSSEFDQILTYNQLELIAGQEEVFRKQGLSQDEIIKKLREYIAKTGLNIVLDEQGKIQTFLSASGFSASGLPTGPADKTPPSSISFADLIKEMKIRQGRQIQYDAAIASKGNLAFTTDDFQIKNANGITTSVNGLVLGIDQGGLGNNAVFFLRDKQSVSARFSKDTAALRNNEKPPLNIAIYQKLEEDNPAGPRMKIGHDEMDKLEKPLLLLYAQAQATGEYEIAGEKPKPFKPISTAKGGALPETKRFPAGEGEKQLEVSYSPNIELQIPTPTSVGYIIKTQPPAKKAKTGPEGILQTTKTTTIMPKIPAKPSAMPTKATRPAEPRRGKPAEGGLQHKRKIAGTEKASDINPTTPKKKIPAVIKVLFISGISSAMALFGALASVPPIK